MEIKTKYNIGDTVYRIINNSELVKEVIHNIRIQVFNNSPIKIIYETKSCVTIGEHLLYKDVEEIITHFKQQYTILQTNK